MVQGIGLALAPIALYFTGLLRLVWDGVVALGRLGVLDHLLPVDVVRDLAAGSVRGALGGRWAADPARGGQGRVRSGGRAPVRRPAVSTGPAAPAPEAAAAKQAAKPAKGNAPARTSTPRWPRSRRS